MDELGSCSPSVSETFQLCAGSSREVRALVGPIGKAPGQGVEGGLPGTGDAGVRLRVGLADEDREKKAVLGTSWRETTHHFPCHWTGRRHDCGPSLVFTNA